MPDPWVAPDSAAPTPPAAPAPSPTVAGAAPAPTPTPATVPVPVPLRPLTIPDVLDGALRAWKQAPATMVAVAAVFVVPAQLLLGLATRDAIEDVRLDQSFADPFSPTAGDTVDAGTAGDLFVLGLVVQGITLALVTAAVARLIAGWYTGQRLAFGAIAGATVRRAWVLAVAWVLVHLAEAVGLLALAVGALVPMTWFAVVSAVVACEPVGPLRALGRSFRLCNRRFVAVLSACLLVGLVDALLSSALTALGAIYLELDQPGGWVVSTVVSTAALLVTMPFVGGVVTLLYLDLRVRSEGLDIELAVAERFR